MKTLLILVVILGLSGCKTIGDAPPFPSDIKNEYAILLDNKGNAFCAKYEILSFDPYKIGNPRSLPISECGGVSGYKLRDRQKILNWIDDIREWAKTKTNFEEISQ